MKTDKKADIIYNSPFKWFINAGAPLFIVLVILFTLVFCIYPFFPDTVVTYTGEELFGLAIGVLVFASLLSYAYPLVGILKLKKQEFIIHKRYKDRLQNGLEQAKREWFVCSSGARLIIYHKDYIESIMKETKEDRHNKTTYATVYLTYIKTCMGNKEKITFLDGSDAVEFRKWLVRCA